MKPRRKFFIVSADFLSLQKSPVVGAILAFFLGIWGAHRFYMRRYYSGTFIAVITVSAFASSSTLLILLMILFLFLSIGESISYLVMIPKVAYMNRTWNITPAHKDIYPPIAPYANNISYPMPNLYQSVAPDVEQSNRHAQLFSNTSSWPTASPVIDVTNTMPEPIPQRTNQNYHQTNVSYYSDWVQKLNIPYERSIMQNEQIKNETLRIYSALCDFIDSELRKTRSSLMTKVQQVERSGGYYDNLLYTIYCIAEGHVSTGYGGNSRGYSNDYSYNLLAQHLGSSVTEYVYNKASTLEDTLAPPNEETKQHFYLTENGKPTVWWDNDGQLREYISFEKHELYILDSTPNRNTKIWNLIAVREEMVLLYLKLWKIIQADSNNGELKWKKTSLATIKKIVQGKYSYQDHTDRNMNFLSGLLKLVESSIRDLLPQSSYTQTINVEDVQHLVNLYLPKETVAQVIECLKQYSNMITKSQMKKMVDALAESDAVSWRIILEKLLLSEQPAEWVETFTQYKDKPDYEKVLKEIVKESRANDFALLAVYELSRRDKLTPAIRKRVPEWVYHDNMPLFEHLIFQTNSMTLPIATELLSLKNPIRKTIVLDEGQIVQSQKELVETVTKLSEYIEDESVEVIEEEQVEEKLVQFDEPTPSVSEFSVEAVELISAILEQGSLSIEIMKATAMKQGKLLNAYLSDINQEFYEPIGDQLLLIEDGKVIIDDYYVDLAKELLEHAN